MYDRLTLPFQIKRPLFRVYGLMRLEENTLVLEFQNMENVLGMFRGRIRKVLVPYHELDTVALRKAFLGGRALTLRCFHLRSLNKVPCAVQGVVELRVRRVDSELADGFVAQLELALAQDRLRQLEDPPPAIEAPESKIQKLQAAWSSFKALMD